MIGLLLLFTISNPWIQLNLAELSPAEYIRQEFNEAGLNGDKAVKIAECESSLNEKAVNINKNGSNDKGIWQINSIHKVPDDCRLDLKCATDWAIKTVKRQGWRPWVCSRLI